MLKWTHLKCKLADAVSFLPIVFSVVMADGLIVKPCCYSIDRRSTKRIGTLRDIAVSILTKAAISDSITPTRATLVRPTSRPSGV